jgi:hypothetical protein
MRVAFYRSHVAHYLPHVAGLALSLAEKPNAVPWDKKEGAGQAVFSAMHDLMRKAKREMEAIPTYTDPSVLVTSGQSWADLLHHAPTDEVVLRWVSVQVAGASQPLRGGLAASHNARACRTTRNSPAGWVAGAHPCHICTRTGLAPAACLVSPSPSHSCNAVWPHAAAHNE